MCSFQEKNSSLSPMSNCTLTLQTALENLSHTLSD